MKKISAILIILSICISQHLRAGVVLEMVTKNATGTETETSRIYAESGKVRIDNIGGSHNSETSIIFRDKQLLMLNHRDKTYSIMDDGMFDEMNSQMSAAMRQMEEQMAKVPPEQRAMMERMMKGRMKTFAPSPQVTPTFRVDALGLSEWGPYSCTQYAVYDNTEKVQEVCAASMDQIEGSGEVMGAFKAMAEFMKKMTASLPFASGMTGSPTEMMDQFDGFPVHTLHYDNGKLRQEVSLESATEQALGEDLFNPPASYQRQDMMKPR